MADIDSMSAAVNSSLADKRAQIDKLVRARRLLKRLEFLFELPRKLSAAVAAEQYDEAVRYYTTTDEILRKYEHIPSLREIHREVSRIADSLRDSLKASLEGEPSEAPKALAEHVDLLIRLGADPVKCEEAAYSCGFAHLTWLLRSAIARADKESGSLPLRVASIVSDVTPRFVVVADALGAVSMRVREYTSRSQSRGSPSGDAPSGDAPSVDGLAVSLFSEYIEAVESLVQQEVGEPLGDEGGAQKTAREAAQSLEVAGDCIETAAQNCGAGDELRGKLSRLARRVATGRLERSIVAAKKRALSQLAALAAGAAKQGDDNGLREACVDAAREMAAEAARALERVAPLWKHLDEDDLLEAAADLVAWIAAATEAVGEVRSRPAYTAAQDDNAVASAPAAAADAQTYDTNLVIEPPDSFADMCERWRVAMPPGRDATNPKRPLAAAVVARELKAFAVLIGSEDDTTNTSSLAVMARQRLATAADERRLDRAASALFSRFVKLSAAQLVRAADLFIGIDNESVRPRQATLDAMKAVDAACLAFSKLVGDEEAVRRIEMLAESEHDSVPLRSSPSVLAPPRAPSGPRVGGIELDVERLFARRETSQPIHDAAAAHWNAEAVAAYLLRALTRAFIEGVRKMVITEQQFQVLELDARYLHSNLDRRLSSVDNLRDLERLISEFLQSSSERCLASVHAALEG